MYVYRRSSDPWETLYTVGFYDPDGKWNPESDHESKDEAAKRVHYLNGGKDEKTTQGEECKVMNRAIIEEEGLLEKVNEPLCALREGLVAKGYTEGEAVHAIAGALPYPIAAAAVNWSKKLKGE